jgi:hypothetical protein
MVFSNTFLKIFIFKDVIVATIHCGKYNHMAGTQKGSSVKISGVSSSFHTYKLVWTPTSIQVSVDGAQMFQYLKEANADYSSWPFDNDFNIILNTAVGGSWGGAQGVDSTVFPQTFFVDYVRYTPYNANTQTTSPPASNQIVWNGNWAFGCDFYQQDLSNVRTISSVCGPTCLKTSGCTHFTWTSYNGGTCWMKQGIRTQNDAQVISDKTAVCGFPKVIKWQGNWAFSCDFRANDLSSAKVSSDQCGPTCLKTSGCTHFSWNTWNGGTCWMKFGTRTKLDAFIISDSRAICGFP